MAQGVVSAGWVDLKRELNWSEECLRLPHYSVFQGRVIDAHTQLSGSEAVKVYFKGARYFGIRGCLSLTQLEEVHSVRKMVESEGGDIHFMAFHRLPQSLNGLTTELKSRLQDFHDEGSRIVKVYGGVHLWKNSEVPYSQSPFRLDSPERFDMMDHAASLGMGLFVHVADPDCYFRSIPHSKFNYTDELKFGRKEDHHEAFERILERYKHIPVIGSHMGGNPENLDALEQLFLRHGNLFINTSATKWILRALSFQEKDRVVNFFTKWQDRILFGTDVVTFIQHLTPNKEGATAAKANQCSSPEEAYRLYTSRILVQRLLWESNVEEESPIKDPDLCLDDADKSPDDAPVLRGLGLPLGVLEKLYFRNAEKLLCTLGSSI